MYILHLLGLQDKQTNETVSIIDVFVKFSAHIFCVYTKTRTQMELGNSLYNTQTMGNSLIYSEAAENVFWERAENNLNPSESWFCRNTM